ncbi:MAG TPA: hypothetical protein VEX38_07735 [Fimbriimonadaceae bacterium]|nr:hypothetical protein [Fimbriimonadaceae bacterium]
MRKTLLITAALFAVAAQSSAVVLYSTGFEAPTFTSGTIGNQDGWQFYPSASFATIQNSVVATGSQALKMDTSTISSNWLWKPLSYDSNVHGSIVTTTAKFLYQPDARGHSAFGFDAYDISGANRVAGLMVGGDGLARLLGSDGLYVASTTTLMSNVW